ncbi:amidase [Kutzneria albida]|uniref:Amidase n=1 Tax=Kutzneria albida DSM 43870 TaxID=1449976 RepID=W5W897_9PSEU|nr:amidase [Kutzneria albida DSM 43870]
MRLVWTLLAAALCSTAMTPGAAAEPRQAGLGFDLDLATIPELQHRFDQGSLTAHALTKAYLHRIGTVDHAVNSVLAVSPDALEQADASDARRRHGQTKGQLDGIPVLLKDNVDTKGLASTAGSRALNVPPIDDAVLIKRLRAAGAVILGKTNLSEWANFRSTKSTSGWSGTGGQTNNPYVLDRNPCGSSSGSGAAVAASLAQVAVGTETDGSIVCPAGQNGVVGLKPSLGLVSRTGVVPISAEQDTAGPMARHVVDAAIALSVLQGRDPRDPATAAYPVSQPRDYAALLNPGALRGARLGIWRMAGQDADVDKVMRSVVDALTAAGVTVVDVELPYQDQIAAAESPALLTEFRHDLEQYLRSRRCAPQTLAALIDFNSKDPVELSKFGQELFEQAQSAPPITDERYQAQREAATSLARRSIDEVLAANHLDAIVAPTNSAAWKTDYAAGDAYSLGSSTPAAVAGYPNVSVPAGFAGALPIGVSFMASKWRDARVLAFAAAFEQASGARRAPHYLPTLPLATP